MIYQRLSILILKLIAPNQGAFVHGRFIFDNISLTQEICREMGKRGEANLILNLDMQKAYDRLECDFLFCSLTLFGFSAEWVDLIRGCVSN